MKQQTVVMTAVVLLVVVGNAWGESLNVDFDSGPGPNFSIVNSGNLWTVGTAGPDVQIAKPLDDRTFLPSGFISGGIVSNFKVEGDFSVTVDFSLHNFPTPTSTTGLNEALLSAMTDSGEGFKVLRFAAGTGGNWIEAYTDKSLGNQLNSLAYGRYRIERNGSEITGLFAPAGSDSFTTIATVSSFSDPVYFELFAIQGTDVSGDLRCNTALDVSFDNLTIVADRVTGVVPEPSTLALLGIGALGLLAYVWRRRKRAV